MIFINFKSNLRSTGENAIALAKSFLASQKETKVPLILAPHDLDISEVKKVWDGEIWVQHADYERGTGRNQVELVQAWDKGTINGVFVNHSEHKFEGYGLLSRVVNECLEYQLKVLVFAGSEAEIEKILEVCKPTYIAYEPPELVGSNETSVAKSKPEVIKKAHAITEKAGIPLIVGAGVKDKADVETSLKLGAVGVAVSSAIILAEDPGKKVLELAKGFGK